MPAIPVVALVGATATGKTALGERLAERLGAEVVCADSRQVFRELEIGTGKPDPAARAVRPHHLFEQLSVADRASAGWYARTAAAACDAIRARGRIPILVGGSGLYLRAAREGLAATPPADPARRDELAGEWRREGSVAMHERLRRDDPETAARLEPGDRQRILRALEVLQASGRPISWWHRQPRAGAIPGPWRVLVLELDAPTLVARIGQRARAMFDAGLIEETRAVCGVGLGPALRRLRAVGYDEALDVLEGGLAREDAIARTALRTRQLAKRQRTWFRHQIEAPRISAALPEHVQLEAALRIANA